MKIIACSDLHLRHRKDIPRWRGESEDEWYAHQVNRLRHIRGLAEKHNAIICIAGDIFHRVDPGLSTVEMFASVMLGTNTLIMPGNHDVRYSNIGDKETGYAILSTMFEPFESHFGFGSVPYGTERPNNAEARVLGVHTLLFENEEDVPYGVTHYETAESLAKKFPVDVLIVGDMHKPFSTMVGKTLVVNCGSMTVQSINEAKYDHGVYIVDTDNLTAEFVPFTDPCKVLSEQQLAQKGRDKDREERKERIGQMLTILKTKDKNSIDFESILENTLTTEAVSATISEKARSWLRR